MELHKITGRWTDYTPRLRYEGKTVWEGNPFPNTDRVAEKVLGILDAIHNATCGWCGASASYVTDFGNLDSDPTDFNAYCSQPCEDQAHEETYATA